MAPAKAEQAVAPACAATDVDVAIIGGGPGGLAAAIALLAVSGGALNVKVFDRAAVQRPQGACITLAANGQDALGAISTQALESVLAAGIPIQGLERFDEHEQLISRFDAASRPQPAPAAAQRPTVTAIKWFDLQQTLARQLPSGVVQLGHRLMKLEECGEVTTLHFDQAAPVRARMVIGADGNTSAVREALFPDTLEYTGVSVWRTMVPRPPGWPEAGWLQAYEGDRRIVFTRSMGEFLTVSALAPWPADRLKEFRRQAYYGEDDAAATGPSDADKLVRFDECFGEFPPKVTDLMRNSDPSVMLEHGVFYRPQGPSAPWGRGNITTLGDAAHVMPPNLGQGTSLALEDAWQLGVSVKSLGVCEAALRHYEDARGPRVACIAEAVMKGKMEFYHTGNRQASPLAFRPENAAISEFVAAVKFEPLG